MKFEKVRYTLMDNKVCILCGMEINEKNYNINSEAFLEENSLDLIKFCPFCGVSGEYISEKKSRIVKDKALLDENILKIIDHAVKLEMFNGDYYNKAAELAVDEKLKKMFKALSRIEYTHARIHQYLGGFKDTPVLSDIDYSKYNNDLMLKEIANKREIHAVEYYNRYNKKIKNDEINSIFNALEKVEIQHIELIEK